MDRNEEIASALGLHLDWIKLPANGDSDKGWYDETGKLLINSVELPDFSIAFWQIKIQERVEKLSCCGSTYSHNTYRKGVRYDLEVMVKATPDNPTKYFHGPGYIAQKFTDEHKQAVYVKALLHLAHKVRKGKE